MQPSRQLVLAAATLGVALLVPAPASAHDLKAFVTVGATVAKVEAGYDDETPAEQATVTVTDGSGAEVATGRLDERGVWTFPTPGPGTYTVVVESAGHRDAVTFPIHAEPADATYAGWRLDKRIGVAVGLAVLLGGTLAFVYLRRPYRNRPDHTTS